MSTNHLIIGLGGTGGKIIRAFRKTIYQEFRKFDPDVVNLHYIYVDSSKEMMDPSDPTWRVLGKSVQLGNNDQLLITGADLRTVLDNLNAFPGIKDWIGSKEEWANILNSIVGEILGGQKRRLGRFLFANKAAQFRQILQNHVRELQTRGGETNVTFHLCCGLAGGTGSGSIIDALALIRDSFPSPREFPILVYGLLPDRNPKANWDTGNYHANGYAAILELNALSVGAFHPHDVTGVKGRLELKDPFNGCYLFSNENERGRSVDVSADVPNIVADFLYQKIVAVRSVTWENLRRAENAENGDGTPEPVGGAGERSKRFLTFGIKRLAIPEQEIREYLTYSFARQAVLQLQMNNWVDGLGFLDEPRNLDFREQVMQKDLLQRWLLSDDHIRLSIGILPSEQNNSNWRPISNTWQDVTPHFKEFVRDAYKSNRRVWLDQLAQLFEKRYEQEYRGQGVAKFYQTKEGDRNDHLREIRTRIERDLLADWHNGVHALSDIRRLLEALVSALQRRTDEVDQKIVNMTKNEEEAAEKVKANANEWAKVGVMSEVFGKRDRLFDAQAQCLQEQYIYRTNIHAWKFAKGLLQNVVGELTTLLSEVGLCSSVLKAATDDFTVAIAARCNDAGRDDLQQQLVKFYNPQDVKDFTKVLVLSKEEQAKQTRAVRDNLMAQLGPNPSFALLNQRIPRERFQDTLEEQCEESSRQAHDLLVTESKERRSLFGDSIVQKLKQEFSGNPDGLKNYIGRLVESAGNYVTFRNEEVIRAGEGILQNAGHGQVTTTFTVFLPEEEAEKEFRQSLLGAFSERITASSREFIPSKEVPCQVKPNEITLISIANLFPLRFLENTHQLKQRYDLRTTGQNSERARVEIHSEGNGTQFPPLYLPSSTQIKEQGLPYVLIARTLNVIQSTQNPVTGIKSLGLVLKDANGIDRDPVLLGKTLVESEERLDTPSVRTIRAEVERLLKSPDYIHVDKKEELRKAVVVLLDEIRLERSNNIEDAVYKRFRDAGRRAIEIINGDD